MVPPLPQLEHAYALRAAWAIPVDREPIRNAQLIVEHGTIRELGAAAGRPPQAMQTIDLGNVALLPGFVNAHAHLEFSDLRQPLGEPGMPLPNWIAQVFAYRSDAARPPLQARMEQGCRQAAATGTTLLADVATADEQPSATETSWMPFRELIGLTNESVSAAAHIARQFAGQHPSGGLSPHAPYTVRRDLLEAMVQLSAENKVPLMTHVGETLDELQLLREGTGPFAELLRARDAWAPENFPGGLRPLDYLRTLAGAARSLIVHGNYLDDEEWEFLAGQADHMSLVFCPRTHAYFRHPRHKIVEAAALGVHCALGTDGRGSSPDLDMLAELRHVALHYGQLPPETIIRMGTFNGAIALGRGDITGSLTPGKRADIVAVEIDSTRWDEPRQAVLYGDGKVVATIRS